MSGLVRMVTLAGILLCTGCDPGTNPGGDGTVDTDSGDPGGDPDGGDPDPGTTTSPTDNPGPVRRVHSVGRFTDGPVPFSSWTLSSHETVLSGDALSVRLDGAPDIWFEIVVDQRSVGRFVTTGGEVVYPLVTGLDDGATHRVGVFRRNEGFFGDVGFVGFVPGPGAELVESAFPYRHVIEFVGDSITTGYGNEGDGPYCSFTGDTENGWLTYAAIAARELDAAAVLVAFSGKGVVQNYGGERYDPMPVLYPRTLTFDSYTPWDFTGYTPDAVVVNLGSNDFSAPIDNGEFVDGYVALLGQIRSANPDATIFAATWNGWDDVVPSAIETFGDPNVHLVAFDYRDASGDGCDSHPTVDSHDRLGRDLAVRMAEVLGW